MKNEKKKGVWKRRKCKEEKNEKNYEKERRKKGENKPKKNK